MKEYTVYYNRLLRTGPLQTIVDAYNKDKALELASKKTMIYKEYLTLTKPEWYQ